MLRRNFLATAGLALTALFTVGRIPLLADTSEEKQAGNSRRKNLHLRGHARSGCATRPEIAGLFENGIYNLPG